MTRYEELSAAVRIAFGEQAIATRKVGELVVLGIARALTEDERARLDRACSEASAAQANYERLLHAWGNEANDRRADVPRLIGALSSTDANTRNAAAYGLGAIGGDEAFAGLVTALRDPLTKGSRGTVVYALERGGFDATTILTDLVECIVSGSYEEAIHATNIIEAAEAVIPDEIVRQCKRRLQEAGAIATDWRVDAIQQCQSLFKLYELDDVAETSESLAHELCEVEARLATLLDIQEPVRAELLRRSNDGTLPETKLVRRWYALYASHST